MNRYYLCEDVLFKEIITKLPVKSLTRFKCVSKGWLANISSECFIADHLHHHSNTLKPSDLISACYVEARIYLTRLFHIANGESELVEIDTSCLTEGHKTFKESNFIHLIGSSNGLVLLLIKRRENDFRYDESQLVLWNPTTREFRNLPKPIASAPDSEFLHCSFGFGKDVNDYKIVQMEFVFPEEVEPYEINLQIYTKSRGCWRQLLVPLHWDYVRGHGPMGVVVDGGMHWALRRQSSQGHTKLCIVMLDLDTEESKVIDGPALHDSQFCYRMIEVMVEWKGSLAVLIPTDRGEHQFWTLNRKGLCWTKLFVVEPPVSNYYFRGVLRDEFSVGGPERMEILFDPVTKKVRSFFEVYTPQSSLIMPYRFHHYVPSLVSPN